MLFTVKVWLSTISLSRLLRRCKQLDTILLFKEVFFFFFALFVIPSDVTVADAKGGAGRLLAHIPTAAG